jgi:hypothetical protein
MSDDVLCDFLHWFLPSNSIPTPIPPISNPILNPSQNLAEPQSQPNSIPASVPELHHKTHLQILTQKAYTKAIPKLHPILLLVSYGILDITLLDQELTVDSRDGINITQNNVSRR